jgi:hypothetical protein
LTFLKTLRNDIPDTGVEPLEKSGIELIDGDSTICKAGVATVKKFLWYLRTSASLQTWDVAASSLNDSRPSFVCRERAVTSG